MPDIQELHAEVQRNERQNSRVATYPPMGICKMSAGPSLSAALAAVTETVHLGEEASCLLLLLSCTQHGPFRERCTLQAEVSLINLLMSSAACLTCSPTSALSQRPPMHHNTRAVQKLCTLHSKQLAGPEG